MKVIIAGSRDIFPGPATIREAIRRSGFEVTEVVCGCSKGVDTAGEAWAMDHRIPVALFAADWDQYGAAAGPRRNNEMAEYADALIAIWDYESRGTRNMIEAMRQRNKPSHVIGYCKKSRKLIEAPQ